MKGVYSVINFLEDPVTDRGRPIGVIIMTSGSTIKVKVRRRLPCQQRSEEKLVLHVARSIESTLKKELEENGFDVAHEKLLCLEHDLKNSIQLGRIKEENINEADTFINHIVEQFDSNNLI